MMARKRYHVQIASALYEYLNPMMVRFDVLHVNVFLKRHEVEKW